MADKKYVGSFQTEHEVLEKIDELKLQGFLEEDIYVVTNDTEWLSMVRGRTDVDLRSPEGNWLDKFTAFLSGDEPVKSAFTNMGFTQEESTRYYDEVKSGRILLYVDRDYNHEAHHDTGLVDTHMDTNLGSNLTDNHLDHPTNVHNDGNILNAEQEERLRLHEERLHVDKERVQAGEVNVGKHVVEEQQTVEIPVAREEVSIERRAVHDEAATGEVFDDGENIHIPIMEETIEVTKRPVVTEEIVVSKREVHDTETVSETVRHEEVDIDRNDGVFNEFDETNVEERKNFRNDPLRDDDRLI